MELHSDIIELPENAPLSLEIGDLGFMVGEGISTPNQTVSKFHNMLEELDYNNLNKKQLKSIIRKLRTYGFKIPLSANKHELFYGIQAINEMNKTQVLRFRPMLDKRKRKVSTFPMLDIQKLAYWGEMGILSDVLGQKSNVLSNGQIQDMSTNNIDSRVWIDSIYSDSSQCITVKKPRKAKRGMVSSVTRNICNRNTKFIKGIDKKPSCINPKTKDASFAPLGQNRCPNCGGLASKPTWRFGGSSVNAKFTPCLVMKPNGLFIKEGKHQETEEGGRFPKVCMIHKQKIGGRHALKINGRTQQISGSFVKVLYPMNPDVDSYNDWVSVWVFVMSGDRQQKVNPFIPNAKMENLVNQVNQITRIQNNTGAV